MKLTKLITAASCLGLSQAGWLDFSTCPDANVVQDFDMEKYFGKWYEAYRSKNIDFERGECVTAEYSMRRDGYVRVYNSEQEYDRNDDLESWRTDAEGWAV